MPTPQAREETSFDAELVAVTSIRRRNFVDARLSRKRIRFQHGSKQPRLAAIYMDLDRQSRARAISQQNTIEFLDGELALCEIFLDIADTEFDDNERRTLATEKAQEAYAAAVAWIGRVSGYELHRIAEKLDRLKERLHRYAI